MNYVAQHERPKGTCVYRLPLIDLTRRRTAQEPLLVVELDAAPGACPGPSEPAPAVEECHDGADDEQHGREPGMAAAGGLGLEVNLLDAVGGVLGRQLGRVGRDLIQGLEDRGARRDDGRARDGRVPVAFVLGNIVSVSIRFMRISGRRTSSSLMTTFSPSLTSMP